MGWIWMDQTKLYLIYVCIFGVDALLICWMRDFPTPFLRDYYRWNLMQNLVNCKNRYHEYQLISHQYWINRWLMAVDLKPFKGSVGMQCLKNNVCLCIIRRDMEIFCKKVTSWKSVYCFNFSIKSLLKCSKFSKMDYDWFFYTEKDVS